MFQSAPGPKAGRKEVDSWLDGIELFQSAPGPKAGRKHVIE